MTPPLKPATVPVGIMRPTHKCNLKILRCRKPVHYRSKLNQTPKTRKDRSVSGDTAETNFILQRSAEIKLATMEVGWMFMLATLL